MLNLINEELLFMVFARFKKFLPKEICWGNFAHYIIIKLSEEWNQQCIVVSDGLAESFTPFLILDNTCEISI